MPFGRPKKKPTRRVGPAGKSGQVLLAYMQLQKWLLFYLVNISASRPDSRKSSIPQLCVAARRRSLATSASGGSPGPFPPEKDQYPQFKEVRIDKKQRLQRPLHPDTKGCIWIESICWFLLFFASGNMTIFFSNKCKDIRSRPGKMR